MSILLPSRDTLKRAGAHVRDGGLVAFPTETVYGLGGDASSDEAVAGIYAAKGRPATNPVIVHLPHVDEAPAYGRLNPIAEALADAYWPGPLTLVCDRVHGGGRLSDAVSAGRDSVALRVPGHGIARAFLEACERPVAAPSANRSGHVSATRASHVADDFAAVANLLVVDGGPCEHGLESAIIDCRGDGAHLLRPGPISAAVLADFGVDDLGLLIDGEAPVAPGQMASHYAPRADLRLGATHVEPDEAALSFGDDLPGSGDAVAAFNLSPASDIDQAAHHLFDALRLLDRSGAPVIAVAPIPDDGVGQAVQERLMRAAAPRPVSASAPVLTSGDQAG